MRDVGALVLAMAIVTAWIALRGGPTQPVAVEWLVSGLAHLVFHTRHLDGGDDRARRSLDWQAAFGGDVVERPV